MRTTVDKSGRRCRRELELASGRRRPLLRKRGRGESGETETREQELKDLTETEDEASKTSSSTVGLLIVGRSREEYTHEKREKDGPQLPAFDEARHESLLYERKCKHRSKLDTTNDMKNWRYLSATRRLTTREKGRKTDSPKER